MKDYYQILEVAETATVAEITTAYKKLIKQHHPDINKSADAEAKTRELNEAYAVLSDPAKKQQYDFSKNPFQRVPMGQPQGMGFFWDSIIVDHVHSPTPTINMTIIQTPEGQQIWINGKRVK